MESGRKCFPTDNTSSCIMVEAEETATAELKEDTNDKSEQNENMDESLPDKLKAKRGKASENVAEEESASEENVAADAKEPQPGEISEKDDSSEEPKVMDSFLQNSPAVYNSLFYVFSYLEVQDLLRAGSVCTMWRDAASHPSLWRIVRINNCQVHSFEGLCNSLQKHGTVHLDMRYIMLPNTKNIWPGFSKSIQKVQTLRKIELCRCPASVVVQLAMTNKDIEVINAVTIRRGRLSIDMLSSVKNLKELRLNSIQGLRLSSDITALKELTSLSHLSLTSIIDLNKMDLNAIAALTRLESLDLGECTDFPSNFGEEILIKLTKLQNLRLENGQGMCHTFQILDAVKNMRQLEQLELVNFDIKSGFDVALGGCNNIRKLLIIPMYISQVCLANLLVLSGVLRLQSTLSHFVWGVTSELLKFTEFVLNHNEYRDKEEKKDCIPVLRPRPKTTDRDNIPAQQNFLKLSIFEDFLLRKLPTTRVKILKIPFDATWQQRITDTAN